MADQEITQLQVDVGILKTQVSSITTLCDKMDKVIDRLMENHERSISDVYNDMENKKQETNQDIKEIHSRITTVDRNLSDKMELMERRLVDEVQKLRRDIADHNQKEDRDIQKILEWKWMAAGGIIVLAWLLSHIHFSIIEKLLN